MLIVVHECLVLEILDAGKMISLLLEMQRQAKPKNDFELDRLMCKRILPTYTLYLQKCYQAKLDNRDYKIELS
jgi:hypothetical protein